MYTQLLKTALLLLSLLALPQAATANWRQQRDSVLQRITGATIPKRRIDITTLGAKGDSATDCRRAFERAMRQAKRQGGARIVVPAGVYLVKGPIRFESCVCLDLREGATLKFVAEPSHYLPMVETSWEGTFLWNYSPFIYGKDLHDVAIVGHGTIDGDAAETFATWRELQRPDQELSRRYNHDGTPVGERRFGAGHYLRPQLVQFYNCRNVTVSSVFIRRSPFWCLHLLCSENIVLRGIRYDAKLVNNDGIDLESSSDVLIDDVRFNNGDDNIAIKSCRDDDGWRLQRPSRNIVIRGCHFKGLHGVVIGSEMSAGVENVYIENCGYSGYCKRGIFVKTNPDRGGYVRNVRVQNVRFGEVLDLFYVTSMYAGQGLDNDHYSLIEGLHVDSLSARNVTGTALVLQGTRQRPIRDVTFQNVNVPHVAKGVSFEFTDPVTMQNCFLGPRVGVPSQVSDWDKIFQHNNQ